MSSINKELNGCNVVTLATGAATVSSPTRFPPDEALAVLLVASTFNADMELKEKPLEKAASGGGSVIPARPVSNAEESYCWSAV